MPIIVGRQQITGDIAGTIARLDSLLTDLERYGDGELPTSNEIAAAPCLTPYTFGTRPLPCLIGGNLGHLSLARPIVRTSEVWVIAPELGWARTFSRLYRLGDPMSQEF